MPPAETRSSKVSRRQLVVIAAVLLVLVGIVVVAVQREGDITPTRRRGSLAPDGAVAARRSPPAEEITYIQALWAHPRRRRA